MIAARKTHGHHIAQLLTNKLAHAWTQVLWSEFHKFIQMFEEIVQCMKIGFLLIWKAKIPHKVHI